MSEGSVTLLLHKLRGRLAHLKAEGARLERQPSEERAKAHSGGDGRCDRGSVQGGSDVLGQRSDSGRGGTAVCGAVCLPAGQAQGPREDLKAAGAGALGCQPQAVKTCSFSGGRAPQCMQATSRGTAMALVCALSGPL